MRLRPVTIDGLVKWNVVVSILLGSLWLLSLVLMFFLASLAPTESPIDIGRFFNSTSPEVKELLRACTNNEGILTMAHLSSKVPVRVLTGLLFATAMLSLCTLYFSVELRKQLRGAATVQRDGL